MAAAVAELGECFVGSLVVCLAGLEFQVEGLDVGHGPAGVPHCRSHHLVGNRIPFGVEGFNFRHYYAGNVFPNGGNA